jgi:uncharacterized protein
MAERLTGVDPFHDGERDVQERAGARDAALRTAGLLGDAIPPRAVPFLAEQRVLAVGSVDPHGGLAASVLFGAPGLASSPDGRSVLLDRTRVEGGPDDPVWADLQTGAEVGLLAIELGSRRRLRVNGVVRGADATRVEVRVREAYPNCPKYIQRRRLRDVPVATRTVPRACPCGVALDEARREVIERADTLFVASRHPARGVDISHRGGMPGFVRVLDASRLRIPDYSGNSMFNTLGNFAVDNRAALAFVNFDRGDLLQMTGTVTLRFGEPEDPRQPTGGTGRYWDFSIARWVERPAATYRAWELLDYSPHNPRPPEQSPG